MGLGDQSVLVVILGDSAEVEEDGLLEVGHDDDLMSNKYDSESQNIFEFLYFSLLIIQPIRMKYNNANHDICCLYCHN